MHHLYPLAKGDPLCPLGFHPQVRWPTRCKRCFRDYKEHGGKKRESNSSTLLRRDDTTASTPSLSWNSYRENDTTEKKRNWVSSSNLASDQDSNSSNKSTESNSTNPSSWTSTPNLDNLDDDLQAVTTVSLRLPKKKKKPIDTGQKPDNINSTVKTEKSSSSVFNKGDSLAIRAKKLQAMKESSEERVKRIQIKEVKTISEEPTNNDVQFLIQVKTKPNNKIHDDSFDRDDDNISLADTETTDTTLVDAQDHELRDQLESIKKELEVTKTKCERLERDKSDILLRRLAAMETTTSKTTATEVLKLQQKCNELQQQLEDFRDDKKSLTLRVKELEDDIELRPTAQAAQKIADELRSKLLAAETLCEELMDENEDIKKELRDMEEQMDEIQDNFREDQVVEYTSLKKELDQTTKNCRILSFKLRKAERKSDQVEQEKMSAEKKLKEVSDGQANLANIEKLKQLEQELKVSNEVSLRLQKELEESNLKLSKFTESKTQSKKKPTLLSTIGKVSSVDGKVSRNTLTRGGSQDDPAQLLRDLQDSLEREADLREQLKFAEEEAQNLHKKVSRIEDDNESLVLQLKKMAGRARSRKLSPTNNSRLTPEPQEKTNLSDDDDPAEVKLQLELSEQEASVLRKKIEDLEAENHKLKTKTSSLQEKVTLETVAKRTTLTNDKGSSIHSQKLKVLEDETNDLRKKLIEKERDCERLHAELSLNQKRSKTIQKSKSLDLDQQTLDLKRQLQIIEQEAAVLRTKVNTLESENEKLISDNKRLQLMKGTKNLKMDKNLDKYIDQIAMLEIDLAEATKKIASLEQNGILTDNNKVAIQYRQYLNRTPKKISNLTSKDQLRTMVNELENEIGEMIIAIKTTENERIKLEKEVRNLRQHTEDNKKLKDLEDIQNELSKEKDKFNKEKQKNDDFKKTINDTEEQLIKSNEEREKLKNQLNISNETLKTLQNEKDSLNIKISKLNSDIKISKDKEVKRLQKEIDEKTKIIGELTVKCEKLSELEKKITETENKLKTNEKLKKDNITELEIKIEEELMKSKQKDLEIAKLTRSLDESQKKLTSQIEDLKNKIGSMETTIEHKKKLVEHLEDSLKKERKIASETTLKAGELQNKEINKLKVELNQNKDQVSELEFKLQSAQKNSEILEDKLKTSESSNKTNKTNLDKKISNLQLELQKENKKLEDSKLNYDKEKKCKDLEITTLKTKIESLELNSSAGSKKNPEFQESINKLQITLSKEKQKYSDLTSKYELLEEEHVHTKAKLVMEKETLESQLSTLKNEIKEAETTLKTFKDSNNTKQNTWKKEKLDLQERLKIAEMKNGNGNNDLEKSRLKAYLEEKQSELDNIKKENEMINDQMEYMRKESDELRKKLDDYQKVNKIQRNINADSSAMDKEIKQLTIKLSACEKTRKTDLTECKMRYDRQISVVNKELQSLQSQIMRFKRERDTYKHMLESAQKTIGELKNSPKSHNKDHKSSAVHYDELEESISKVASLEQQISCMEDELSETRVESSRLKTELVSERSSWEVKVSELHSRINELEEEKVLSSGRTKIVGLRTRMELAWQKEREEQQRLLQETATLARDLRQTLFEVERERDKERLEAKRKQDQFKKTSEEDQDENKKKINELQCDLLELRDAHAKLRTTNEKLRREKERYEKEREDLRLTINGRKKSDKQDDIKINSLTEQIHTLKQLAPEMFLPRNPEGVYTPTPPRRTRSSKSRETSPISTTDNKRESSMSPEDKQQQVQYIMQRLVNTAEELRQFQRQSDDQYEVERLRRAEIRRATSTEHENISDSIKTRKLYMRQNSTGGSLHRKSLSLEHNIQTNDVPKIWKADHDSVSSLQSLNAEMDRWTKKDLMSLDSRLSGDSTQSDFTGGEPKKKKGIIGKLKKLTKSRSIDDQDPGVFPPTKSLSSKQNSNSDINEDSKGSKKDFKERITGIFKRGGSSSRSNSLERQRHDTSSTQRPLVRNDSNKNLSRN